MISSKVLKEDLKIHHKSELGKYLEIPIQS